MANTYTWDCGLVDVIKSRGGKQNIVRKIRWKLTGTNENNISRTMSGWATIPHEESDLENFVEYENLTASDMVSWVQNIMTEFVINDLKEKIDLDIQKKVDQSLYELKIIADPEE